MKLQRITTVLVASLITLAIAGDVQAKGRKSVGKSSGRSSQSSWNKSLSGNMKSQGSFKRSFGNAKNNFNSSKNFVPKMNGKGGSKTLPFPVKVGKGGPIKGMPKFKKSPIHKTLPFPGKVGKLNPIKGVPNFKNPKHKTLPFPVKIGKGGPNFKNPKHKILPFPVKIGKGAPHFKHKHHDHHWRHRKHRHCWWWYDYCRPLHHCEPVHYNYCDWNYVRCDYVVGGQTIAREARWYLGVKGMILPGKGLGIESVAAGSPAALAGLSTGMVIQQANGIDLVDEAALATAIQRSNGVLSLVVVNEADGQAQQATIQMTRLVAVSY